MKGTLIETAEDTSKRPIAIPRGLRSGFARATMLRNEDALLLGSVPEDEGRNLEKKEGFGLGGVDVEEGGVSFEPWPDGVEYNLCETKRCRGARV